MSIVTDNIKTDSYLSKDGTREYGRCTAWVNFDGTGVPTIRDSLNVASITDNGTGSYTVNFAQSMANINYVVSIGRVAYSSTNSGNGGLVVAGSATVGSVPNSYTINGFQLNNFVNVTGKGDPNTALLAVYGGDA